MVASAKVAAACPDGNDRRFSPFGRVRRTLTFVTVASDPATISPWLSANAQVRNRTLSVARLPIINPRLGTLSRQPDA